MTVNVKLDLSKLHGIQHGLDGAIAQGVQQAAEKVAETARGLAPVRTGDLRDSISAQPDSRPQTWRVQATVPYAVFVEFGTRRMHARPYLIPALRQTNIVVFISQGLRILGIKP